MRYGAKRTARAAAQLGEGSWGTSRVHPLVDGLQFVTLCP